MAKVYINSGDSFEYSKQLGSRVILEYTDGTEADLPDRGEETPSGEDEEEEEDEDEEDTPVIPEPEPEPEPEPPSPETPVTPETDTYVEPTCKSVNKTLSGFGEISRHLTTKNSKICLKKWHSDFKKCIAFARTNGLPMLVVWSNKGCGHCEAFESSIKHKVFREFMEQYKLVWCFVASTDKNESQGSTAWKFCFGLASPTYGRENNLTKPEYFPMCCFYWFNKKKKSTPIIDTIRHGDQLDGGKSGKAGAEKMKTNIKNIFDKHFVNYKYDSKTGQNT